MKNNKGFSLVELIIVIAIMAVLIGVLAPQYLKYVEKSKAQSDLTAMGEVYDAVKIAVSDPDLQSSIASTTLTITATGVEYGSVDVIGDAVKDTLGNDGLTLKSNTYKGSDYYVSVYLGANHSWVVEKSWQ